MTSPTSITTKSTGFFWWTDSRPSHCTDYHFRQASCVLRQCFSCIFEIACSYDSFWKKSIRTLSVPFRCATDTPLFGNIFFVFFVWCYASLSRSRQGILAMITWGGLLSPVVQTAWRATTLEFVLLCSDFRSSFFAGCCTTISNVFLGADSTKKISLHLLAATVPSTMNPPHTYFSPTKSIY